MVASAAGGMPPLNVSIRITTTGAKAAANAMRNVTGASQNMSRGFGTGIITARTLGDAMRMSASLMKYTVAGAFMKVGQAAIQAFRNFELSFSRIRGLVGISRDEVEKMKESVLGMAGATTRAPEELAEALYFITSAGIRDSATAMSVLESSARAAAAGLGDTKTVADAVTSAMNAYGLGNLSAASATNILVAAVREGKAEADTFAPAFSKVLPVAAAFGASFNDVAAAMAALTRSGMTAGTAGIYVRQTLSQLLKPSKQGRDALAAVGTSADEVRKNITEKGLLEGLMELSTRLGGTEEGTEKFAKVFGNVRALTSMLQLVGPAAAENEEIFRRMSNTTGDLDHAFMSYEETIDAKYNKALADSRVALIKLGEALKPVASALLDTAALLSRFATTIANALGGPVTKVIVAVIAGFTLLVVAMAATMKTTSALIRLFANLTMTMSGTQIMYNANTHSLYRLTAAQVKSAKATTAQTLAKKGYVKVNIGVIATLKAMKNAIVAATVAMKNMVKAHPVLAAIAVAVAVASAAFVFFKKRADEAFKVSTKNMVKELGKVNELLDQTVAYGKINIGFKIETDTLAETQLKKDMDRIREQINEQTPDLMAALDALGDKSKAIQSGAVKALMEGKFANLGEGPKNALLAMFKEDLNITEEDFKNAVIGDVTGDSVADAIIQVSAAAATGSNDALRQQVEATGKLTIDGLADVLKNARDFFGTEEGEFLFKGVGGVNSSQIVDSLKVMGEGFVDFINTSKDMTPLILALERLDEAGINNGQTFQTVMGVALAGLSENLKLASARTGNFFEIFAQSENIESGKLQKLVEETAKIGDSQAATAVEAIRKQLAAMPKDQRTAAEGFRTFMGVLKPYMIVQTDVGGLSEEIQRQFEAERDSIKGQIEEYTKATSTIKQYSDAQRALRGLSQDQEESLRNLMDAYQGVGDAIQKSGGSLSMGTEGGRKAREEVQQSAEALFAYANAVAATDPERAGQIVKTGMENIASVAQQAGGTKAGVAAIEFLEELGFTAQNFRDSIVSSQETADKAAFDTGKAVTDGIAKGLASGQANMEATLIAALNNLLVVAKSSIDSESPSKLWAKTIGLPMAQGVGVGFNKEMKKTSGGMAKDLQSALLKVFKTGNRQTIGKYLSDFLEKKKNVETPAQDFVKATIGRMKDIIGSLGSYIRSQLSFRDAQSNLAKLINMQRKYDDDRKKSAREVQYSETRRGGMGGAEVTGYEQAEIDQLQLDFERVSRDYAMGRASYVELVDAEIALFEARAAASEVTDEVISAQNNFIDSTTQVENKNLELAGATVGVLEAYQDVQEAAYELYINHKELEGVYNSLAKATGIASGKIVVGSKDLSTLGEDVGKLGGYTSTVGGYVSTLGNNVGITGQAFTSQFYGTSGIFGTITKTGSDVNTLTKGIGADFVNLSRGLLNTESEMYKNLQSLGPAIFNTIQLAAQEALDKSPLNLKVSVNASVSKGGSGSVAWTVTPLTVPPTPMPIGPVTDSNPYSLGGGRRATGGPVTGMTPYMVGERGPEMFIPKVSGTIVTNSALDRYTRTKETNTAANSQSPANNIVVTVNNPVPAAAEDSITRRMKVLSNQGLFG